jgi:hypothetical protein
MMNVIAALKKEIAHFEMKIANCDEDILGAEKSLSRAKDEREAHVLYIAEVREAIAELSPEGEPLRVVA